MKKDKHNILFCAHSGFRGGAEYCLDTILSHLNREQFQPVVCFAWDGPMVSEAQKKGCEVYIHRMSWWLSIETNTWYWKNFLLGSIFRIYALLRIIREHQIHVVYTNTAMIWEGAIAAKLANIPHVWHVHEVMNEKHMAPSLLPLNRIIKLIGKLSKRVIFESKASREICRSFISEAKARVVYNSVRFTQKNTSAFEKKPINHDKSTIIWVGRFSSRKNPMMLLRALSKMRHKDACKTLLIGEGPLETEIRSSIDDLNLKNHCKLIPFQKDILPFIQSADVLVLTSNEESFGLVLVEAGVFEIPVVATCSQGPKEIVDDGTSGFLVAVGDDNELARRLDDLISNKKLRHQMGKSAKRRVEKLFSAEKNTKQIEAIIKNILNPQ